MSWHTEFLDMIKGISGRACANVNEPSPGDLERVLAQNAVLHEQLTSLSVKLQRTTDAAHSALLEMSAHMGILTRKRQLLIDSLMEDINYCAEHDLRHFDESQAIRDLNIEIDRLKAELSLTATPFASISEMLSGVQEFTPDEAKQHREVIKSFFKLNNYIFGNVDLTAEDQEFLAKISKKSRSKK